MRILVDMSSSVLSLRLPQELKTRLDRLSDRTQRPAAMYVQEALEAHLEDLEDYYDAVEISQRIRAGEEELISLEDARRELLGDFIA